MAPSVPAVCLSVGHRGDGGLQLGRPGERGLLGGVLLQSGQLQHGLLSQSQQLLPLICSPRIEIILLLTFNKHSIQSLLSGVNRLSTQY